MQSPLPMQQQQMQMQQPQMQMPMPQMPMQMQQPQMMMMPQQVMPQQMFMPQLQFSLSEDDLDSDQRTELKRDLRSMQHGIQAMMGVLGIGPPQENDRQIVKRADATQRRLLKKVKLLEKKNAALLKEVKTDKERLTTVVGAQK